MTEEMCRRYFFGENFVESQDLISEKLEKHGEKIRQAFAEVHPEDPGMLPLGKLKELWLHIRLATRCIMVKAGTEYHKGSELIEDPGCLTQLYEHVALARFMLGH